MTQPRKQILIELVLTHLVFNLIVFGIAIFTTWLGRENTDDWVDLVHFWLLLPALIGFPFLMLSVFRSLHGTGEESWSPPTFDYIVGLALYIVPMIVGAHYLVKNIAHAHQYQEVEFATTAEVARFYRESNHDTRMKTAIYLPELAPVPINNFGHVTGIIGHSTKSSHIPRQGRIIRTHFTVWPIFTYSEAPTKLKEFQINVWEGITRDVTVSKLRRHTKWYRFHTDSNVDAVYYNKAVAKALEPEEINKYVRTNTAEPVVLEIILEPPRERRFWILFFWIALIGGNMLPLGIWGVHQWKNHR